MDLDLTDKVVLVTGGSKGIGAAIVREFIAEGAHVVNVNRSTDQGEALQAEYAEQGKQCLFVQGDLSQTDACQRAVKFALKQFDRIDVLVNNAGIVGAGTALMEDVSFESWRQVMTINLDAVFLGCQAAIRKMKSSGGGSIINISSIMGMVGGAGAAYNASKGGVRLLSKSVAVYCGNNGYNIRCNSIHPGYIWTPMVRGIVEFIEEVDTEDALKEMLVAKHPIGRLGEADDIAKGVLFLASDESSFMTGSELVIDGGYTAV